MYVRVTTVEMKNQCALCILSVCP